MSWISQIFKSWAPNEVTTELCHLDSDLERQTVKYDSIEHASTDVKRRGSDATRYLAPCREHHSKINNFASSSSLLGLLQEIKDRDDWKLVETDQTKMTIIKQPRKNSPSILPFSTKRSKTINESHTQIQGEYIETIKTQFFNLGISTGASLQLFLVSFLLMFASASTNSGPIRELSHEYYPVFRGILLISFFFSLYGANIFIWRRSHIDYLQVIGASYTHTYQYVLRGSTSMAYITFTMFMIYFLTLTMRDVSIGKAHAGSDVRHIWPALAVLLPFLLFICPWDSATALCYGVKRNGFKQRLALLREIAYVLISPFSEVTFLRSFIADIFCSMPRVFTDLQYTVCIYVTGTFLTEELDDQGASDNRQHAFHTCGAGSRSYYILQIALGFLPYFIRLCQSFRAYADTKQTKHLFNALKYSLSLSLTALAVAHQAARSGGPIGEVDDVYRSRLTVSWISLGIATTLYSFYWDVVMDWGLGNFKSINYGLRDDICFQPTKYYASIGLDFIMRLGWAFVISPEQQYIQQNFMLVLSAVELVRRFLWAIHRVEWEHIQITRRMEAKTAKIRHDRLATMYFQSPSGPRNFSFNPSARELRGMLSNRSSFKSENTSNTGLSVLTEADEREGKYSFELGSRSYPGPFPGGQFTPPSNCSHALLRQHENESESELFEVTTSVSQQSFHSDNCPSKLTTLCMSEEDYLKKTEKSSTSKTKKSVSRGHTQ